MTKRAAGYRKRRNSLTFSRLSHTATLLANGQVLVVGGQSAGGVIGSAELYNPALAQRIGLC